MAAQLGLHVRTVRKYVRDGRLNAVRIGKQYRIAREDLEALTGRPAPAPDTDAVGRHQVDVSSVVQIETIRPNEASRMTNLLIAATAGNRDPDVFLRVETVYDQDRARLKVVVLGGLTASAEVLRLIGVFTEGES